MSAEKTQPWTDEQRRDIHESVSWMAKQTRQGPDYHTIKAQRDALLEALMLAVENGCATVYANEHDERGERGCCGVVSYKPHADDCWVTKARAAIKAVEESK